MKCAIVFDSLGPYHSARIAAGAAELDLEAVAFGRTSKEYQWNPQQDGRFRTSFVNPKGTGQSLPAKDFCFRLHEILHQIRPDVVAVPGWSGKGAFAVMRWAVSHGKPIVMMSESTCWDEPRVLWKEAVKSQLVGLASAALVGGAPHADYMYQLGMPAAQVFLGYDTVDNAFFAQAAAQIRKESQAPAVPFFLASNRFVKKKNLFRLLSAYSRYAMRRNTPPWELCLLGDGILKEPLLAYCQSLGLEVVERAPWEDPPHGSLPLVFFPGFRQIDDLPRFYANAGVFVHASTTEQWGLVVNEAMASGLPVLVSNRVGCAQDLVQEGINGFTFDPMNVSELSDMMVKISEMPPVILSGFGDASQRLIADWRPERFASGLRSACEKALEIGPKRGGLMDRLLLFMLALK